VTIGGAPVDEMIGHHKDPSALGHPRLQRTGAGARGEVNIASVHQAPRGGGKMMAEGKGSMSGWRIAANIVGATLGFLLFGAGGCEIDPCPCPPPPTSATIELGCVPTEPPKVKTTGPCSVCGMPPGGSGCAVLGNAPYIVLLASGAGTCHVEIAFGSGNTSSVDVDFVSDSGQRPACCGTGEGFVPVTADGSYYNPTVQDPACDAGQDAAPAD